MKIRILVICIFFLGITMFTYGVLGNFEAKTSIKPLYIWHDLGKNGDDWLYAASKEFKEIYPEVEVIPVSMNTQQWLDKSISALLSNQSPDLLFNNYERLYKVEEQTKRLSDLSENFDELVRKQIFDEKKTPRFNRNQKVFMIPVQEVQMAFGIRKSWLNNVGGKIPETWGETKLLAEQFTFKDPNRNGLQDTYGFALESYKPRDLVHMIDLFNFGSGGEHTIIDKDGNLVLDQKPVRTVIEELYQILREGKLTPKETVYYGFTEMYQVIEGNQAGIFRVGDWNINKWDKVLDGDYLLAPWPSFDGMDRHVVIAGIRGVAVPQNAPNQEMAEKFAAFLTTKSVQMESFMKVGSCLTQNLGTLDLERLSEKQLFFAEQGSRAKVYDFPEMQFSYYSQLEQVLHRRLMDGIKNNQSDFDSLLPSLKTELLKIKDENKE